MNVRSLFYGMFMLVCLNCTVRAAEQLTLPDIIAWAEKALPYVGGLQDYAGKAEIYTGKQVQEMHFKVRHQPFAVFLQYINPIPDNGKQALWRADLGDKLWVFEPTRLRGWLLKQDDPRVVAANPSKYKIQQFGLYYMLQELARQGKQEQKWPDIEVTVSKTEKVETCVTIRHTQYDARKHRFYQAVILVDEKTGLPSFYGSYTLGKDGKPVVTEFFRYYDVRVNPGLKPIDFSERNPNYGFNR